MPISYRSSNILDSDARLITIPVNCKGTMGAGLALSAAKKWPHIDKTYRSLCNQKRMQVGITHLYYNDTKPGFILFPTKDHWKDDSRLEYIEQGLQDLKSKLPLVEAWGDIDSIAMPALGCGLGNLMWDEVRTLIEYYLSDATISIEVYKPHETIRSRRAGRKTPFDPVVQIHR